MYAGGDMPLDVGDVLAFFSGASKIPPTGFETLNFRNVNIFPTASKCAPTKYHDDYQKFKDKMHFAIMVDLDCTSSSLFTQ